jgi:hypothetical protein
MRLLGLTAAAAVVFAASGTAATIPKATYVQRADAICLDVAKRALALQAEARRRVARTSTVDGALRVFADLYRRQLVLVQSMRRRLIAIGEPRGATATARLLVDGVREGERALRAVMAAVDSGSTDAITRAALRYRDVSLASARAVKRSGLGFRACGAGA